MYVLDTRPLGTSWSARQLKKGKGANASKVGSIMTFCLRRSGWRRGRGPTGSLGLGRAWYEVGGTAEGKFNTVENLSCGGLEGGGRCAQRTRLRDLIRRSPGGKYATV